MLQIIQRICFVVCVSLTFQVQAETEMVVHLPDQQTFTLTFPDTVRVDEAVMTALQTHSLSTLNIDWLNSSLFDISNEKNYQHVVQTLATYEVAAETSVKGTWQALLKQLHNTQFGQRIFTPLDPDITRLSTEFNPRLHGKWKLILKDKPESVHIFGAVLTPDDVTWHNRFSARSYLNQTGLLKKHVSRVTVIQPDGQVETHPIAYWNEIFNEVAPGATIYVPMPDADALPSEQNANQLIVELLRNRIPL